MSGQKGTEFRDRRDGTVGLAMLPDIPLFRRTFLQTSVHEL